MPSNWEKNVATTPGDVVFQNELMQLIQYRPSTEKVHKRPILIMPPWINKYYILDLQPEKLAHSNGWFSEGHSVFVVSWVNPDESLSDQGFEDYFAKRARGGTGRHRGSYWGRIDKCGGLLSRWHAVSGTAGPITRL